jgi:hypothetical protein
MIYLPQNAPVKIDLGKITGKTKNVWWFDVRTGNVIQASAARGNTIQSFTPPVEGKDWVLVLDDATKKFTRPGEEPGLALNQTK